MVATKPTPSEVKHGLPPLWSGTAHALNAVWEEVLEEMLTLYYPPFRASTDEELLEQATVGIRAYVEDLAEFRRGTLADAWRTVRRQHKTERWPTIHAIRDACLTATGQRSGPAVKCELSSVAVERWMERWGRAPETVPQGMRRLLGLGEYAR